MDIDAKTLIAASGLALAIYGLIYKHVSRIHEKLDRIATHVHAHDRTDAVVQTALEKQLDSMERRLSNLEK